MPTPTPPQTREHSDLAWKFLLAERRTIRPVPGEQDRTIMQRVTFQHVHDTRLALVVLAIARMNDATPGKLITRHMIRNLGIPAPAVDHAFNILLHQLDPKGSDPHGVAFEHGKAGRATGVRIIAVAPANPL